MHKWIHACMCDSVCIRKLLRFSLVLIDLTVERISYTSNVLDWYGLEGIHIHTQICVCVYRKQQSANVHIVSSHTRKIPITRSSPSYSIIIWGAIEASVMNAKFYFFISRHIKTKYSKHSTGSTVAFAFVFGFGKANHSMHKTFTKLKCLLSK